MAEFKPTPDQRAAIESIGQSVCVRAGAGTGKTAVLVGRYLELLESRSVPVTRIVAMTYTEKAAREMKDRIRRECAARELREAAPARRTWWRRQRVDLETADISTIHGFCASVLREHPIEAGIDPHFAVIDEVTLDMLVEQCVADVIESRLEAEDAASLELLKTIGRGGVHEMLKGMLLKRASADESLKRIEAKSDDEVLAGIGALVRSEQIAAVEGMLATIERSGLLRRLRGPACRDPGDKLELSRAAALGFLNEIASEKEIDARLDLARGLAGALSGATRGGSRKSWSESDMADVKAALKELKQIVDDGMRRPLDMKVGQEDRRSLTFTRTLGALYRGAEGTYAQRKSADGLLDFDDLLLLTRSVLTEREDVRTKVRERIRYLLVDELQDSALIERDIVLMMARDEKTFAETGELRILPGRLFVVGDDKQSIYRFRGAEVTVFRQLAKRLKDDGEVVDLTTNFRTVPAGVAFANDLFSRLMPENRSTRAYESEYFRLSAKREGEGPFLDVMIPSPVEGESLNEARQREARMIAERIAKMIEPGKTQVFDRETRRWRDARFGDVAILLRAMTDSRIYERSLRDAGIPYYVLSGSGFFQAQEIRDVLHLLKALEHPRDEVALAGVLRSPVFGINDETLFFMRRKGSIRQGLESAEWVEGIGEEQRRGIADAAAILHELAGIKNRVPLARLMREALARTGFDATLLAQFAGRQKLANVEKLIDQAEGFEQKGIYSLDEFIRQMEDFIATESRESERAAEEESSDVVTVMSVHKAKGLEFPIVFVADASRQPGGGRTGRLLFDRDLGASINAKSEDGEGVQVLFELIKRENARRESAEYLRLLYVALTRARDRLIVSGGVPQKGFSKSSWMALLVREYDVLDDDRLVKRRSFVYGDKDYAATVRVDVPEPIPREERRRERAGWRAVRRLRRLIDRLDEADRAGRFEYADRVSPVGVAFERKRRFVASEFVQYGYCPRMYELAWIDGMQAGGALQTRGEGAIDGRIVGTLVHRILAAWDFKDVKALEGWVDSAMTGMSLSAEEASAIRAEVLRLLTGARKAGLFDEIARSTDRRCEFPVAARVGDFVVEGIIDDLHRRSDGAWELIDYKTDRAGTMKIEELAAHYELQLAAYALALGQLKFGVSRVSLVFLRAGEKRSWNCDARQLDVWKARLREIVAAVRSGCFEKKEHADCRCPYGWTCGGEARSPEVFELE